MEELLPTASLPLGLPLKLSPTPSLSRHHSHHLPQSRVSALPSYWRRVLFLKAPLSALTWGQALLTSRGRRGTRVWRIQRSSFGYFRVGLTVPPEHTPSLLTKTTIHEPINKGSLPSGGESAGSRS